MYIFCESDCVPICQVNENTVELRRTLKDNLRRKQDIVKSGSSKHDRVSASDCDKYFFYVQILTYLLQIRLGLPGWKSRFYGEKFGAETSNEIGKLQTEMVLIFLVSWCK